MQKYKNILRLVILLVLFTAACSPESRYKVLSFIFDGVPEPDFSDNIAEVNDSVLTSDSTNILNIAENNKTKVFFHQPYLDKDCNSCHSNNDMGQKIKTQPELCYTCHENFEDEYAVIHGPVAGGYCTDCHDPHKSKFPELMLREGKDICLKCHDPQIVESDIHSLVEINECVSCHNPHGEENTFLLKKGSCYVCHDNFSEKYKYLHGPVAGGFCNSCHDTHSSESEYKLLLTGQKLCYKCHTEKAVLGNENHEGIDDVNCTECHNPHGGDDKYLFN